MCEATGHSLSLEPCYMFHCFDLLTESTVVSLSSWQCFFYTQCVPFTPEKCLQPCAAFQSTGKRSPCAACNQQKHRQQVGCGCASAAQGSISHSAASQAHPMRAQFASQPLYRPRRPSAATVLRRQSVTPLYRCPWPVTCAARYVSHEPASRSWHV